MASSIFMGAMEAIRDAIRSLSLSNLTTYEVMVRRLPYDAQKAWYRGITIHPVTETYDDGTTAREGIGYGCAVTMVANNDCDADYQLDQLLLWREQIRRYFVENSSMTSVATIYTLKVEHGYVIDYDMWMNNYDVSRLVIRAYSLETRT